MLSVKELLLRGLEELLGRGDGPLQFRLILQPLVASFIAICAARRDLRERKRPFVWAFVREPSQRRQMFLEAWREIGRLFLVGVALDIIYQLIVLRGLRPLETLIVATTLAVLPYLLVRGLANRIMAWWSRRSEP
ncbi:MAG: hypothetical protein J5I93_08935 [Pirellulaceae bacterium]|nr:hypothetical protein [Pirellulaceae bacterium]